MVSIEIYSVYFYGYKFDILECRGRISQGGRDFENKQQRFAIGSDG